MAINSSIQDSPSPSGMAVLSVIGASSQQVAALIMTVLAARYLLPAEFGTYMLAVVFAELGIVFTYSGFFHYLINSPRPDEQVSGTLFWVHLGIGSATGVILLIAAHPLAWIFSTPDLAPMIVVFAVLQPFAALIGWATGNLKRSQRMRRYFWSLLLSNLAGVILGAVILIFYQSLFALVAFRIARLVFALLLFLPAVRHRPRFGFDREIFCEASRYARSLYGARLAGFFAAYGTDLLLALVFTTAESGLYRFANRLAQAAIDVAALPLKSLALKSFGFAARKGLCLSRLCTDYLSTGAILMGGIALTQIILGERIIQTLFTADYTTAIWAFYALSLRHAAAFGSQLVEPVMAGLNQTQVALRFHSIWAAALLLTTTVLTPFGLEALALGQAFVAVVGTVDAIRIIGQNQAGWIKATGAQLVIVSGVLAIYGVALSVLWHVVNTLNLTPLQALTIGGTAVLFLAALFMFSSVKWGILSLRLFSSR